MKLVYTPDGEAPQEWKYKPGRIRASDAELLERRTGMSWGDFNQQLARGSVLARRALLWYFLRQTHATLRFEDVDFALDELTLEFDRDEWAHIRRQVEETKLPAGTPDEMRETLLAELDREAAGADEAEGKASASTSG
jgi:hypothetical protein